jgi:hypothetical protein
MCDEFDGFNWFRDVCSAKAIINRLRGPHPMPARWEQLPNSRTISTAMAQWVQNPLMANRVTLYPIESRPIARTRHESPVAIRMGVIGPSTAGPFLKRPALGWAESILRHGVWATWPSKLLVYLLSIGFLVACNSSSRNRPPDVQISAAQVVLQDTNVVLAAQISDKDGSIETILWEQVAGPAVELNNVDTQQTGFQAPRVSQDVVLTFKLTVTDSGHATTVRYVTVTVVTQSPHQVETIVSLGDGVVSPYKLLARPDRPSEGFLVTGQGESYGTSYLYAINLSSSTLLHEPLAIGRNCSDLLWVDQRVVVASRSGNELYLVDPDRWVILDRLPLGFPPISLTRLREGTLAVGGASAAGDLAIVSIEAGALRISQSTQLGSQTRAILASLDGSWIFVSVPAVGLVVLDAFDLSTVHVVPIDGTPSFSILQLDGRYVSIADRDGYVRLLDLVDFQIYSTDLAVVLGLDRSSLPLRGIDPISLVHIDANHFAVLNDRQPSIIFDVDLSNSPLLKPVVTMPSASYAVFVPGTRELLAPKSDSNSLTRIRLPDPLVGNPLVTREVIGRSVISADLSCLDNVLATMDTGGGIRVTDGQDTEVLEPADGSWQPPIAYGHDGTLFLIGRRQSGNFLVRLDRSGKILSETPISLAQVYSIKPDNSRVVLTDRIAARIQVVDLSVGVGPVVSLSHSRPRHAVQLGANRLVVIHDTQPDIGITLVEGQSEVSFTSLELHRWWSNLLPWGDGAFSVASTFGGSVALIDDSGGLIADKSFDLLGVTEMAPASDGSVWITSGDFEVGLEVAVPELTLLKRVERPGLVTALSCQGSGRAWMVTKTEAARVRF